MLLDRYGAISIGEVVSDKPFETIAAYTNDDRLHMAYCFEFLSEEFDLNTVDVIAEKFFKENLILAMGPLAIMTQKESLQDLEKIQKF